MFLILFSEGYTSISVREPLANIIAQTKKQNALVRRREMTDSHYATVSDDSGIKHKNRFSFPFKINELFF